ncbi:MAG: hypothetical protein ISR58_20490 [Anaerolineales bacterium]|nr:hypothetical protein [Chloroflexota bacterium]MBL6983567.1 hypothetical protein [Anaerolineales bacterium]
MSGVILVLGSAGSALFEDFDTEIIITGWVGWQGILDSIPDWGLRSLAFITRSYRYYLLVFSGFVATFYFAARYIRDIYNLENARLGMHYLRALLFGIDYPRLNVQDGEKQLDPGEVNLLDKIGGPGYLVVQPGSLALLEGADGEMRVCGEGSNYVTRLEKIRETIRLEDQQGYIESTSGTTKDGVTIKVNHINYSYRLRTGRMSSELARQNPDSPNPFSYQAVLNMVFGRSVGSIDITPWHNMVNIAVDGAIIDYIRANLFDVVTAPSFDQDTARVEITRKINSKFVRNRLANVGAELIWVDIGHFEVVDKRYEEQRIKTWGAKWSGLAEVKRAFGDAKRTSYLEQGRAEAQADILMSIMSVFEELGGPKGDIETIRAIILSRTAQLIEGMSHSGLLPRGDSDELPPPTQ